MKKFVYVFLLVFFVNTLFSQTKTDQTLVEIEEQGISQLINHTSENFSIDSTLWTSLPASTTPMGRTVSGVIGEYLYIFASQGATSLAISLHIPTKVWVASTPPTAPGYNSAFCVANGEIYKLSGTGSVNAFEKFTPTSGGLGTWTTLTGGPTNVMNAQNSMVFDGSSDIYVSSADYSTPTSSFLAKYNIQAGTWQSLTGSPSPKRYAGMAAIEGKIYLIGGLVPSGVDPQVCQRFDPATNQWSNIAPIPEPINFAKWTVSTDGRYLFVITSGGGYSTYPASDNIYYYDPVSNQWGLDCVAPQSRGLAIGHYLTGYQKLFFGGGNTGGSGTNFQTDCWEGTGGVYVPVEFTAFSVNLIDDKALLSWTTASETNNYGFHIEKKNEDGVFASIGFVQGAGNSTTESYYSFTDYNILDGKSYYRLKQVDYDGSLNYSNIIMFEGKLPVEFNLTQNYPNPFNPTTAISYSVANKSTVQLKVYNMLGAEVATLVNEVKEAGKYNVTFDASELTSGVYLYKLTDGNSVSVKKLMLLK